MNREMEYNNLAWRGVCEIDNFIAEGHWIVPR